jgi:hypothetical protein
LRICHARTLDDDDVLSFERGTQFVEEAGLPDTCLADDADDLAAAAARLLQALAQQVQLAAPADQRRQSALGAGLQARALTLAHDAVCSDGLGTSLDGHEPKRLGDHASLDVAVRGLGRLDRGGLGGLLHPRGKVRCVADSGVIHAQVVADLAHDDGPAVEPDPYTQLDTVLARELSGKAVERRLDRERGLGGAQRVIFECERCAEERHQPIAEELVHRALVAMDRVRHEAQNAVHQLVHYLGIEPLGHTRRLDDVGEQHGHLLALALERNARCQDAVREVRGSIRSSRRCAGGAGDGATTRRAEARLGAKRGAAAGAVPAEHRATMLAEPRRVGVGALAGPAVHLYSSARSVG